MIVLNHLTLSYRGLPVLQDVSGTIERGAVVLLTGETGSGKTSLVRTLYGDMRPDSGSVTIDGLSLGTLPRGRLPALRRRMGLIFQDDKLLDDRNVYDNIRFALSIQMRSPQEIKRKAMMILAELGLSHPRSSMPWQLSGGEAQRIGVARALANDPELILADEPTGDLDPQTASEIFSYLASRRTPDRTFLIVTHDPTRAESAFPDARHWRISSRGLEERKK